MSSWTASANRWIELPRRQERPLSRVYCFHHAGGGASAFRQWVRLCSADIEICPVQLPGRESRSREAFASSLDAVVRDFLAATAPELELPFALAGHSMGATLAYAVAQSLQTSGGPLPLGLCVSAALPPHLHDRRDQKHEGSNGDLLLELQRLGGTPAEVLGDADLSALVLQRYRADLRLLEQWQWSRAPHLSCPILALGGARDPSVSPAGLAEWRQHTSSGFGCHLLEGGHCLSSWDASRSLQLLRGALLTWLE